MELKVSSLVKTSTVDLTAEVEYIPGITFKLRYVSKARLAAIVKSCTVWRVNRESKVREPEIDTKLFQAALIKESVLGWTGITPRSLKQLIAIDNDSFPPDKLDEPIDFTPDNMLTVMQECYGLDTYLQNSVVNIGVFQPDKEIQEGNSPSSPSGS